MRTDISLVRKMIETEVMDYLSKYDLQSVVIGISGGADSAVNAVMLHRVCSKLAIPVIGRYIHIETNKEEERQRAEAIGKYFCDDFESVDMTDAYHAILPVFEEDGFVFNTELENFSIYQKNELDYDKKVRRGNIKARLRMIYLYNLAQRYKGLVIDNDNLTENQLGFFTLHGDVGDLTPMASLYKTKVWELGRYYCDEILKDENEKSALKACVDCVPTDGLGITSSDTEQFGVDSYETVDSILKVCTFIENNKESKITKQLYVDLCDKYGRDAVDKIYKRHIRSSFKRNNPYKIEIKNDSL